MDKHPFQLNERHKRLLAGLSFLIFILLFLTVAWFIGRPMVRFVQKPELFREWVDAHGICGNLAFLGMMFLQVVIAVIPGEPLEIGAGYAFGFWEGTLLCMLGIFLGSAVVFLLVRRFGTHLVEVFFDKEKIRSLKFLQESKKRDLLIFFVMFIPGTPKDLLSYFAGLTDITLSRWLDFHHSPSPFGNHLHSRGKRCGRTELPLCDSYLCRNLGNQCSGSLDLPAHQQA